MSNRAQKMYKLLKNYNGNFNYQYNESSEPSNKYVEIPNMFLMEVKTYQKI